MTLVYFTGSLSVHLSGGDMSKSIIAAAALATFTLLPLTTGTFAAGSVSSTSTVPRVAAPGPLVGAGPVGLVIGGVGYGVYWLVKRRRRKTEV
jgi:hypothetical protein